MPTTIENVGLKYPNGFQSTTSYPQHTVNSDPSYYTFGPFGSSFALGTYTITFLVVNSNTRVNVPFTLIQ